jgi:hypothetical protein
MTRAHLAVLAVMLTGCIDRMILDGTIKSTREASSAFDTLSDLEVAKLGAGSSIVTLEGENKLAPDNLDGLFLLTQSWVGYGGAFIEDDWEQAVDRGDDEAEVTDATRALHAYDRALTFGIPLLEARHPGFKAATKNYDTITAYLKTFEKEDAENLLWVGAAWLSRGGVASEKSEIVADLFVGVAMLERSVELDDTLVYGLGLSALGAYHARAPDAELKQAKEQFEKALAQTQRKALSVQVLYAQNYACNAQDEKLYRSLLEEVLKADDPLPQQRLENTIAQRKRCGFGGKP